MQMLCHGEIKTQHNGPNKQIVILSIDIGKLKYICSPSATIQKNDWRVFFFREPLYKAPSSCHFFDKPETIHYNSASYGPIHFRNIVPVFFRLLVLHSRKISQPPFIFCTP